MESDMTPGAVDEVYEGPVIETVSLATVEPQEIDWLWPERIARGKVTLIVGDPDKGKSLLTVSLAASVSIGAPWPVGGGRAPEGNVLMLTAEDDLGDTVRPRLDAAGADVSRIDAITMVDGVDRDGAPEKRMFSLREHLDRLDHTLSRKPYTLLTIDPLSAYLQGVDTHRNADVRTVLAPLQEMAQRHHVAVVCIEHLNKGTGSKAMYRVSGSLAFVAAARTTYVVGLDESDPARRLMIPSKNNISAQKTRMAFSIGSRDGQPVVLWESEPVTMSADDILMQPIGEERTAMDEALDFINAELDGGPVEADKMMKRARAAGISERTLKRAKGKLGVVSKCRGFQGVWKWYLPCDLPRDEQA